MPYYKLFTSSSPSLHPIVHACSPLSAKAPGYFSPQCQIYHRYTSPAGRSSLSKNKKIKNVMRGPDFYFHYDCEGNMWPFTKDRTDDLQRHTLISYSSLFVFVTQNCFEVQTVSIVSGGAPKRKTTLDYLMLQTSN